MYDLKVSVPFMADLPPLTPFEGAIVLSGLLLWLLGSRLLKCCGRMKMEMVKLVVKVLI